MGKNKLISYIRLIRPVNSVMMGFAVLIGFFTIHKTMSTPEPLVLGFLTSFALTGASMVVNDIWDRGVDAVNEPSRPIPSGEVSISEALTYAMALIILGLASAYLTNPACLLVAAVSLLISLTYSTKGKEVGLWGNFMVSACVAIPFIYGALIYRGLETASRDLILALSFALMAFLSNTGREVAKDIADVKGDKVRNVVSVALKYGSRRAAMISSLFYLLAVLLSVFVWLFGLVSLWYLPLVIVADAGFILSSIILVRDYSRENAKKVKSMVLAWMFIGLLAFITGGF